MLDAVWIGIAFVLGLVARAVGLPPLVGYLVAGFALYGLGIDPGETLDHFAEIGVTLLLFTIGLKLKLGSLLRPQVWAVATLHMSAVTLGLALVLLGLATTGLSLLDGIAPGTALLLGFALSFSSTVFAVKVLEEKGEMSSIYGTTAIGILILQDIAAVGFLAASVGKIPSPWALALIAALWPLRLVLLRMMNHTGHGELLILFGLTVALGGAKVFDMVSVKGDLGALVLGIMLAGHRNAPELARALLGFKDLFLVGFFLVIGLKGFPSPGALVVAVLLALLVPAKSALYCWLLTRFQMRARTAFLAALSLSNYSEFGLIVAAIAATNEWLADEWLTTIAVALSVSFALAAPFNTHAHRLYERLQWQLRRCQRAKRLPEESVIDPGDATTLIFGMGRVGTGAYDALRDHQGEKVVGIDLDADQVARHQLAGRDVIRGSATDPDFWSRIRLHQGGIRLVMLAMPRRSENVFATEQLKKRGYTGEIAAIAKFDDDVPVLRDTGVDQVFNLYAEAGAGFADHVRPPAGDTAPGRTTNEPKATTGPND